MATNRKSTARELQGHAEYNAATKKFVESGRVEEGARAAARRNHH
jgi:hypothetical protein